MPTISVIIPNYNHAPYLKERIDSVLNQTYQDFEVIILDDKSTDNSKDVIEQYRNHPKISHIIYNEINSGSTFKQWEKGIELATGEWIWIAESDDWCEYSLLENLTATFNNSPKIGLSYCMSVFYNIDENTQSAQNSTSHVQELIKSDEFILNKLFPFNTVINASAVIFKKDLYYKVSKEYTHYKLAGDWFFWAEISQHCDVAVCGKYLNYFRQHDIKVSMNTKKRGLNYPEEIHVLKRFQEKKYINEQQFQEALIKHYLRFKYSKFPFNEGVIESTKQLFYQNLSAFSKKKIRKIDIKNKIEYKYLGRIFNFFIK